MAQKQFKLYGCVVGVGLAPLYPTTLVEKDGIVDAKGFSGVLAFELALGTGGGNMVGFKIQVKTHRDGSWIDYLSGTDFDSSSLSNMLFATTTGPHEVTAGNSAAAMVRLNGVTNVRFCGQASSTSSCTISGSLTSEL